jgi:hypothetical protein
MLELLDELDQTCEMLLVVVPSLLGIELSFGRQEFVEALYKTRLPSGKVPLALHPIQVGEELAELRVLLDGIREVKSAHV